VSCIPFQIFKFCDASFDNLERENFTEQLSFDERHDSHKTENIDDPFHIERHRWDINCFHLDRNLIYHMDDDASRVRIASFWSYEQPYFLHNEVDLVVHVIH
jgi:hypothetical protein